MTPGVVIAATRSGAGKTTITLGLMRALVRRGHAVQPFKCGPDYIDPAFHGVAAGRPSYNLDHWAMSPDTLAVLVADNPADIAVAEGVMGLFDGTGGRGATADVAATMGWPVVLVLDVAGQTETAAAIAAGCANYRHDVSIAGVILNRVSSSRHLSLIAPALARAGIPLLGSLPRDDRLTLPERHLGLVQVSETGDIDRRLDAFAAAIGQAVDLDAIVGAARPSRAGGAATGLINPPGQRIALARDIAFSFAYPHLLAHWRSAGAEIMPFSPLAGDAPPRDADAIWLPGGYPELHAGTLAQATHFHGGLRRAAARGVPIHGECGGYMVLGQGLEDAQGQRHAMAGLLGLETSFAHRRLHLGYRQARLLADGSLGKAGMEILGHEFHYATVVSATDFPLVDCRDAAGGTVAEGGARRGSVSGSFFHAIARNLEQ
ncbi:MAG: cobyrinate a,c-diamide synthase [Reyranella sp.]|uniref:cobyrinate a,c-diamide synthase n=1 Tax=Reyranella sp. TaxID=1929291 RepID=UPI001212723B|nr:cobyrinate a,c-diamide synthase [Reyranella sp.]TAJ91905.1 MAG: cobyrinate a,c-diamide synthase [Reyranella sp.]TBR29320.1 MAG: cobyrinate a,c-diamide synthase [Reyranella sp.]